MTMIAIVALHRYVQVHRALTNVGYFVSIKTWFNLLRPHFEQASSLGLLRLIAPLLAGVTREELLESEAILDQLLTMILKAEYIENFQVSPCSPDVKYQPHSFSYLFKRNYCASAGYSSINAKNNSNRTPIASSNAS